MKFENINWKYKGSLITNYVITKNDIIELMQEFKALCELPCEIGEFSKCYYLYNGYIVSIYGGLENIEKRTFKKYSIILFKDFYTYCANHQFQRDANKKSEQILYKETYEDIEIVRFGDPQMYWSFKLIGKDVNKFNFGSYFTIPNGKVVVAFEYRENDYLLCDRVPPFEYFKLLANRDLGEKEKQE